MSRFVSYPASRKVLFFEAFFLCLLVKGMVVFMPFRWVKRLLGLKAYQADSLYEAKTQESPFVKDVFKTVDSISRHVFWENTCLVRSISIKLMLRRRNIAAVLYLGLAKVETGELKAHAWLKVLDSGLIYDDGHGEFTPVAILI